MPGVFNLSVDEGSERDSALRCARWGCASVIFFGLPDKKDEVATGAWEEDGIRAAGARAVKRESAGADSAWAMCCLCEYMSHGPLRIVKTTTQSLGAAARRRNEYRPRSRSAEHQEKAEGNQRQRASMFSGAGKPRGIPRSSMTLRLNCLARTRYR